VNMVTNAASFLVRTLLDMVQHNWLNCEEKVLSSSLKNV
jgi:hypothetical protein